MRSAGIKTLVPRKLSIIPPLKKGENKQRCDYGSEELSPPHDVGDFFHSYFCASLRSESG